MLLKQFYSGCFEHSAYLIGDEETQMAALIDPLAEDTSLYMEEAYKFGNFQICFVLLTHQYPEFNEKNLEQWHEVGASVYIGKQAKFDGDILRLNEEDQFEFGALRLKILETPGHSEESVSILVFDLEKSTSIPTSVFSGDALFIGNIGRPDILASIKLKSPVAAKSLYHSLFEKLLKLPDKVQVFGTHGSKWIDQEVIEATTLAELKKFNPMLWSMDENKFIELACASSESYPIDFVNRLV